MESRTAVLNIHKVGRVVGIRSTCPVDARTVDVAQLTPNIPTYLLIEKVSTRPKYLWPYLYKSVLR